MLKDIPINTLKEIQKLVRTLKKLLDDDHELKQTLRILARVIGSVTNVYVSMDELYCLTVYSYKEVIAENEDDEDDC